MLGGVGSVDRAMMPDAAALALVPATELLVATSSAVGCSESLPRPKLHPTSLVGVAAPDAAEKAGEVRRIANLILVLLLPLFVAADVFGNVPLPSHGGPACNACFPV